MRIVESFEKRYIDFAGLNLTFEVREGIIKHSRDYDADEHPELAEYLLNLRPPLEAQLIDLADEIAYNTADLDDGFEARLLPSTKFSSACVSSSVSTGRSTSSIPTPPPTEVQRGAQAHAGSLCDRPD